MQKRILQELDSIEQNHNAKILFAIESGSRAWGFPSPDSDYDVRFVYIKPLENYLAIDERRDVIELPVDEILDINGWDIRKALMLFAKSNAPFYEWLQSPILYRKKFSFAEELFSIANNFFSPRAGIHHYVAMTKNCLLGELQGEAVKIKKYFYALRPILAARWIALQGSVPPMEFSKLLPLVEEKKILSIISDLLERKETALESEKILPIPELNSFVEKQIEFCDVQAGKFNKKQVDLSPLNEMFRRYLSEVWT